MKEAQTAQDEQFGLTFLAVLNDSPGTRASKKELEQAP